MVVSVLFRCKPDDGEFAVRLAALEGTFVLDDMGISCRCCCEAESVGGTEDVVAFVKSGPVVKLKLGLMGRSSNSPAGDGCASTTLRVLLDQTWSRCLPPQDASSRCPVSSC